MQVQGLILAVMYERSLGADSAWGPYLSVLPSDLSHMLVYWDVSGLRVNALQQLSLGTQAAAAPGGVWGARVRQWRHSGALDAALCDRWRCCCCRATRMPSWLSCVAPLLMTS